jgi:deoxyuridine 5'-triphosphate nucleotidohydrolase
MLIKFLKIRDVKSPARTAGNAGFDFFVPNCDSEGAFEEACNNKGCKLEKPDGTHEVPFFRVAPHTSVCIPSGIKSLIPNNEALIAMNKSGIALKRHLDVGACVIDPSYEGEIHMHLTNTSNDFVEISCGDKIVQFVPIVYDSEDAIVEDANGDTEGKKEAEFYKGHNSERGAGGFGSTGTR